MVRVTGNDPASESSRRWCSVSDSSPRRAARRTTATRATSRLVEPLRRTEAPTGGHRGAVAPEPTVADTTTGNDTGRNGDTRWGDHRQRRGRGGQPVDSRRDAVRLVLPAAGAHVLRPASPQSATTTRCTRTSPRASRRTPTPRSGRSSCASGITFTDGTPVNADAVDPQPAATPAPACWSQPVRRASRRRRKQPGPRRLKIDKVDDLDVHDLHRQGRRSRPSRCRGPASTSYLTGQLGLIASRRGSTRSRPIPTKATPAGRHRPVHRAELRATRLAGRDAATRTTGRRTPTACSCRTSTRSRSSVIEDAHDRRAGAAERRHRHLLRRRAPPVIADFRDDKPTSSR